MTEQTTTQYRNPDIRIRRVKNGFIIQTDTPEYGQIGCMSFIQVATSVADLASIVEKLAEETVPEK